MASHRAPVRVKRAVLILALGYLALILTIALI